MYDYDRRRVADAAPEPLKTSVRFKWGGDALIVSLYAGRKLAGKLLISRESLDRLARADCQKDLDALASKGLSAETFWTVENVAIQDEFQNKGLGKRIYEAAFAEVAKKKGPFYVGPYSCLGHGTSAAAERVWNSLSRKYPSSGHVFYVRG